MAPFTLRVEEDQVIEEDNVKLKRVLGEKDLEIEILRDLFKNQQTSCQVLFETTVLKPLLLQ